MEAHELFLQARHLFNQRGAVLFWSALHELAAGRIPAARTKLEQAYELAPASGGFLRGS